MNGRQAHRTATIALSVAMLAIGVVLVAQAIAGHGGAISPRLLLGVLFIAAGLMRTWLAARRRSRA